MKPKLLLTLFVLLLSAAAFGLGSVRGTVVSESKETLPGAHVLIQETCALAIADREGNFIIRDIADGRYILTISFIGYETLSRIVEVKNGVNPDLKIFLKPGNIQLSDLVVMARDQQSTNTLTPIDIKLRPTNNSQDILRMVPGLFIAQHAGGGKAEQIFLRGFDIDHGTDLNLEVDGLPVNMVSHAHGQGYADLHFIIPELINYVDFDKGPYFANKGDFTTAGYVDFQTKNTLEENLVKFEGGQFGTVRAVAGVNLFPAKNSGTYGYVGSEVFLTDGFADSPQNFSRFNITSKITTRFNNEDKLSIGASYFRSKWDASGQIPDRAVERGMITRFGSIDNTEGGETSRTNLFIKHIHQFSNEAYLSQQAYGIQYDFNLFSNFTFYLNHPVDGDQIQQKESRMIYGYKASYNSAGQFFGKALTTDAGIGIRLDHVDDIALSHTVKRQFTEDIQRGDVSETNVNVYIGETLSLSEKWSLNTAVRFDYFIFDYKNSLLQTTGSAAKGTLSPKVNVNYQVNSKTLLYLRTGLGFHSNDARVVTEHRGKEILPKAYGVDLGANMKATDRLFLHAALWRLDLDQEFVYVGDEGIIEPSGKTRRIGVDFSLRFEILPWLFLDGDLNLTKSNAKDKPEKENYIPLAPTVSSIGGISFNLKDGVNGALRYRYIGNRAANENNSVIAEGYVIADAVLNYTRPKYEFGISIENLFDTEWNEAQFDTESRLIEEHEPVSEIHFTPGTPLFFKVKASFFF